MRVPGGRRGQAIQVGAVILFGFLVVAFAGYQAVSVPNQNGEVEFQHSMRVTDQMQEFRTDVIEAASTGSTRSQAFALGTDYPARLFAVNPPPISGQLTTTTFGGGEYVLEAPGASLEDICGLSRGDGAAEDVPSKALTYEANYNQYTSAPTIVYENTVTYREFPGRTVLDSGQTLVDGRTLTLVPLTGDVSESTSTTRTVDLSPGAAGVGTTNTDSDATYTLTVPTGLDRNEWSELLAEEDQVDDVRDVSGGVAIDLLPGEYTVICPPVGVGTAPDNDPSDEIQRGGDGGTSLNPSDSGEVRLDSISLGGGDSVDLTFENTGDEVELSNIRYNFYSTGPGGTAPDSFDLEDTSNNILAENVRLRGPGVTPDETVTLPGDDSTTLSVDFDSGIQTQDYFVIEIRFSDGQESLYFVDVGDSDGNSAPTASFSYSPSNPSAGQQVDFDASGSSDSDGSIVSYSWDFGNGDTGTGVDPSQNYSSDGTYTVELTVEDGDGATSTTTQQVNVGGGGDGGDTTNPTIQTFSIDSSSSDRSNVRLSQLAIEDSESGLSDVTIDVTPQDGNGATGSTEFTNLGGQTTFDETDIDIAPSSGNYQAEVYDVTVTATDDNGNTVTESKTVDLS